MSRPLLCLAISSALLVGAAYATLTLPWSTIDNGGGRSTGGTWTLTGTVGQFDATSGSASGGSFRLNSGFWVEAVASPSLNAPVLTITRLPNGTADVSWPNSAIGWQLQVSTELVSWSDVGSTINSAGSLNVTPNQASPRRFYRLIHP